MKNNEVFLNVYIDWYTDDPEPRINGLSLNPQDYSDQSFPLEYPELAKLRNDTSAQLSYQMLGIRQKDSDHKTKTRWHAKGGYDMLRWLIEENPEIFGKELLDKIRDKET